MRRLFAGGAARIAHRPANKGVGARRSIQPFRAIEDSAARASAAIIRPFQSASTLSSRPGRGRFSRAANSMARNAVSRCSSSSFVLRAFKPVQDRHVIAGLFVMPIACGVTS